MENPVTQKLLDWYKLNKRAMPWRDEKDPYRVWVSEIMLQQTRVETVRAYYERWISRFPNIAVLANANRDDVLRVWEGLGYYSRARKLHEGAQAVMSQFGGTLPVEESELLTLPGIGPYTAAAIASFAFNKDALPVDANLSRVLGRFAGIDHILGSKEFLAEVRSIGIGLLPKGSSADFNQALMDLGAMVCLPAGAKCIECPLADQCQSKDDPTARPKKPQKPVVPTKFKIALLAVKDEKVLLYQRKENGLLGGMWEFPAVEVENLDGLNDLSLAEKFDEVYQLQTSIMRVAIEVKHAYTHFRLIEQAWYGRVESLSVEKGATWVAISKIGDLAMGKVDRTIARHLSAVSK